MHYIAIIKQNEYEFILTLFLPLAFTYSHAQPNNDSVAIVKLLEKAAATFRSGDVKTYADCWKIHPCSVTLISSDDGKAR